MTREEKIAVVHELGVTLSEAPNIYIVDGGGLNVEQVNNLRRLCSEAGVKLQIVKNTLLKKALDNAEGDYDELYGTLKQQSAVFFTGEDSPNSPAGIIKTFQKSNPNVPKLKSAYVGAAVFIGEDQLDTLAKLKSKNELIGEIISLLQSPAKNVLGALQSAGQTLAGIIKTLQEREA